MRVFGAHWRGRLALLLSVLLWLGSIGALLAALQANEAAGLLARRHGGGAGAVRTVHLHEVAVLWAVVLTVLQVAAMLVAAGTLRGFYRLRSAVCFAVSGGGLVLLNALWIFGLLVWMRLYGETR